MENLKRLVLDHPLRIAAGFLLVIAVVLAVVGKVAAGSLVAGLFIVVCLFEYLPEMESFKAYGIEAKLRQRLNQADEVLLKLKQTALASARLTYHTLGWGSRFGGDTQKEKQAIADATDAALISVGVEATEIANLKKDYLFFSKVDIFQTFDAIIQMRIDSRAEEVTIELQRAGHDDMDLRSRRDALLRRRPNINLIDVLPKVSFRDFCQTRIPDILPQDDLDVLRAFALSVAGIVEACEMSGRVTDEAIELIPHVARQKVYERLFSTK